MLSTPIKHALNVSSKTLLIVLYAKHVVGPDFLDCPRNVGLSSHRVDCDNTTFQHERFEKLRNGLDLV